jgi:5'-3' exonuclease
MSTNHPPTDRPTPPRQSQSQGQGPVLLLDTSYIVFAKWFSTLSWYKLNVNRNPDIPNIVHCPIFTARFAGNFERSITRTCNRFGVRWADVVYCRDCSKMSVWRRDLFGDYKASRVHSGMFNREIFAFTYATLVAGLMRTHGGTVIGCETAEADDVIAVVHSYARRMGRAVIILTNDNDAIQLLDDGTRIVNLTFSDVGARRGALTPDQYLLSRILSGDRSDNIPSVLPTCGMKSAARLVQGMGLSGPGQEPEAQEQGRECNDWERLWTPQPGKGLWTVQGENVARDLDTLLATRPGAAAIFERNLRLMSADAIPPSIRQRVLAAAAEALGPTL